MSETAVLTHYKHHGLAEAVRITLYLAKIPVQSRQKSKSELFSPSGFRRIKLF